MTYILIASLNQTLCWLSYLLANEEIRIRWSVDLIWNTGFETVALLRRNSELPDPVWPFP